MYYEYKPENEGVYKLLSKLCEKAAEKYSVQSKISQKALAAKLRSQSYEIILKKSASIISPLGSDPFIDLLSYYFVSQKSARNVAEYKKSVELKTTINNIRSTNFGDQTELVNNVLKLLNALQNSVNPDLSAEMFQNPFSFGLLDEMLPKPKRETFGSPQPYSYFPSYVFELPYSLKSPGKIINKQSSKSYTEYTVESFDSRLFITDNNSKPEQMELKTFLSPMSLASMTSTALSPYSETTMFNYPRLTAPRDLIIPTQEPREANVKISFVSTNMKSDVKVMFGPEHDNSINIWEIASQIDKDVPNDIWEIVSKLPPVAERQVIAASAREMTLWKQMYSGELYDLNVISEKQFIRHIMYLIIGVETNSFPFSQEANCFYMKDKLVIEGISEEYLVGFVSTLLQVGTYYRRLYNFAFNLSVEDDFHSKGLVYEAAREVIRKYLLDFRLKATTIYEDGIKISNQELNCMPTLLQILHHVEPLKYEIETIASIYKMVDIDSIPLPHGASLMSYLFSEISLVTHKRTALILYNFLFSICKVYFKFIERFIFEGELNDVYNEFFIRKDEEFVNSRSKRYWDKGFHITLNVAIPDFLRPLASFILLCGKSLRLLKLCNPNDPLVQVMCGHPRVWCCSSFPQLVVQQQVMSVYRTRCRFVSEPVTFTQLLLKREAERKAFSEMASNKRAETLEKIVAERKRLAQLIIAEKQHSLRVLEAAMAEAKENKNRKKRRERRICEMESEAARMGDVVDTRLRDDEKNKIMEYYSKLNIEVEKNKIHTEWKIKRLQLDQSRMQLLSTEERNLKREKLELEHQKNESIMAMSIQSDFKSDDEVDINNEDSKTPDSVSGKVIDIDTEINKNKNKAQSSSDVFSAICNVAKSIFGVSKAKEEVIRDNEVKVDVQGNIVNVDVENNQLKDHKTSSNVIGADLNEAADNLRFLESRQNAMKNKLKVMNQEFGTTTTDAENNRLKDLSPSVESFFDQENNIQWNPHAQAKRNKLKVLSTEFDLEKRDSKEISEPKTEAQKAAIINKQKVLGVEYNAPIDKVDKKDPINIAQEEALRNKHKVLSSDYEDSLKVSRFDSAKKAGLRLNLKPYSEVSNEKVTPTTGITPKTGNTPTTGPITPGEFFLRLDLETPTTAEMPTDGPMTGGVFTPRSDGKDLDSNEKPDKEFLTSDGFNFSMIVDEETEATGEVIDDGPIDADPDTSPSTTDGNVATSINTSVFKIMDGSYSLEYFDPFGVKDLRGFSKDYFNNKINEDTHSFYTHPAIIMEEMKKKPYNNIFASQCNPENEEIISCDNIATLTACLRRSVMLPLTYQLEVVNNSILTYFLVNLDMYEHMRSLRDYFFLMDGEFSRSICHNLFSKLTRTANPQELLNFATLHDILDKAFGSSISHVHKFSEGLSFSMVEPPLSFQHSSPDVLQCLSLSYSVGWPLNIILSHEALLRYAKVFQFLIKMRRIFWVLSEDFEALKLTVKLSRQHSRKLLKSPQYISIQIYRHVMASLIRALDDYIVTACILTSWTDFEKDLKKARTLDDLYECHVAYIKKVLFRCLLNNRSTPVMKLLNDIFTVILKFSRVLKAGEWQQKEPNGNFTHPSYIQLEELFHLFEKLAKYLYKVITKLMECGYQRHLVELLTMINLNGYYDPDKSKEDTNLSIQSN